MKAARGASDKVEDFVRSKAWLGEDEEFDDGNAWNTSQNLANAICRSHRARLSSERPFGQHGNGGGYSPVGPTRCSPHLSCEHEERRDAFPHYPLHRAVQIVVAKGRPQGLTKLAGCPARLLLKRDQSSNRRGKCDAARNGYRPGKVSGTPSCSRAASPHLRARA